MMQKSVFSTGRDDQENRWQQKLCSCGPQIWRQWINHSNVHGGDSFITDSIITAIVLGNQIPMINKERCIFFALNYLFNLYLHVNISLATFIFWGPDSYWSFSLWKSSRKIVKPRRIVLNWKIITTTFRNWSISLKCL